MLSAKNPFPDELAHELIDYARDVVAADSPETVLNKLHAITSKVLQLNVWIAMKFPERNLDWAGLELKKTVFIHLSMPPGWWERWIERVKKNQPLFYTLSRMSLAPFTATEALKMLDPIGIDRWSADLAGKFGVRDAFFCPIGGRWVFAFWSRSVLSPISLTSETRTLLAMAANFAVLRLDHLVEATLSSPEEDMTPRELAVLRLISEGYSSKEAAAQLGIGEETVKTHIQKAQIKLGAKNRTHTACEAIRRRLIA